MGKASRRRKGADHGSATARVEPAPFVARPFEGLPGETDWVAMREILPAATATVTFAKGQAPEGAPRRGDRRDRAAARLARPAPRRRHRLRRHPVGLDLRRRLARPGDLAAGRRHRRAGHAGRRHPGRPPPTPRACRTCSTPSAPFEVTVHEGFDFWVGEQRARRRGQGLARARQRVGHPHRQDVRDRLGLLVPHRRAHPHPPRAARGRGRRHRRPRPPARRR